MWIEEPSIFKPDAGLPHILYLSNDEYIVAKYEDEWLWPDMTKLDLQDVRIIARMPFSDFLVWRTTLDSFSSLPFEEA